MFAAHVSCRQVVESQSKKVFHSEAFYEMSKDTLCRVLRVDRLSVHEIDVFRACLHWAERRASLLNLALTPASKRQVGPAPCDFVARSYLYRLLWRFATLDYGLSVVSVACYAVLKLVENMKRRCGIGLSVPQQQQQQQRRRQSWLQVVAAAAIGAVLYYVEEAYSFS